MSKESRSSCIREEDRVATACIWDTWYPSSSQSEYNSAIIHGPQLSGADRGRRWLQDVFDVPLVVQLTGEHSILP